MMVTDTSGHKWHECDCYETGCMFCDGGLSLCDTCGSFEGATTTDCPGERMPEELANKVYAGYTDFQDGKWVNIPSKHSPAYWNDRRNWDTDSPEYVDGKTHIREYVAEND